MTAKSEVAKIQNEIEEVAYSLILKQLETERNQVIDIPMQESFGEQVDMTDAYLWDNQMTGQQEPLPSRATDRKDGDNFPFWITEWELSRIRGIARHIATLNEVGAGAIDVFVKYVVGTGFTFGIESKLHPEKALAVEAWVDEWDERVAFTGDFDEEIKKRELGDGDYFVWINPLDNGKAGLRVIEPDEITEPNDAYRLEEFYNIPPGSSWKYGIATCSSDTSQVYGYFVSWNGSPTDTQFIPAEQMVHVKRNVTRRVKRGVSDFYCVYQELRNAEKLLRNMTQGASTQAAIALIRNHAEGVTKEQIKNIAGALAARTIGTGTNKTSYVQDYKAGMIIDSTKCTTEYGPIGSPGGGNFELILQAAYRTIGTRWHLPEYMISGDASNGSYASTLVAESPFVKTAEVEQARTGKAFNRMRKIVARMGAAAGKIPGVTVEDIDLMKFTHEGVRIVSRERDKEVTADKILVDAGAMSVKTFATRNDLDYEDEVLKGAKPGDLADTPLEALPLGEAIRRLRKGQEEDTCGCSIEE
ncbi:MAG: phage portal protein [Anaerolineae bacterium]|nr:phage portal protein [Anaerolineae bacterium]